MKVLKEFVYKGRKVEIGEVNKGSATVPPGSYTQERVYLVDKRPLPVALIFFEFADLDKAEATIKEYIDDGDV